MKEIRSIILGSALSAIAIAAYADDMAKMDHHMVTAKEVQWNDGPPSLPPGAKLAVIDGDPAKEGPFTMRAKLPAKYKVPPHTHPGREHVTVIEGTFQMGLGEKWDDKAMKDLAAGSFAVMEKGTKHFAGCKKGCTIQIHGIGPWGINYVNPADDPRNAPGAKKPMADEPETKGMKK